MSTTGKTKLKPTILALKCTMRSSHSKVSLLYVSMIVELFTAQKANCSEGSQIGVGIPALTER